jgi:hypothetical protein
MWHTICFKKSKRGSNGHQYMAELAPKTYPPRSPEIFE